MPRCKIHTGKRGGKYYLKRKKGGGTRKVYIKKNKGGRKR